MWILMLITGFPLIGLVLFFVIPWKAAFPIYILGVGASVLCQREVMKSMKLPVMTGVQAMTGGIGTVTAWQLDRGTVQYHAEIWRARSENGERLGPGAEVTIMAVERLQLVVVPRANTSEDLSPGGGVS